MKKPNEKQTEKPTTKPLILSPEESADLKAGGYVATASGNGYYGQATLKNAKTRN